MVLLSGFTPSNNAQQIPIYFNHFKRAVNQAHEVQLLTDLQFNFIFCIGCVLVVSIFHFQNNTFHHFKTLLPISPWKHELLIPWSYSCLTRKSIPNKKDTPRIRRSKIDTPSGGWESFLFCGAIISFFNWVNISSIVNSLCQLASIGNRLGSTCKFSCQLVHFQSISVK